MSTQDKDMFTKSEVGFMRRAIELAANGLGEVKSNPMVGAVIVSPNGDIIGEGYHRRYGEAHAEVNAVNSVSHNHRHLLPDSTIYVTLEPCSHYGKTPPCSKLLIDVGIRNVVVAARDPFEKVDGRGLEMLRQHGCNVRVGLLERESESLNARFFTAHRLHRPFVTLKWAQTADGFMDVKRENKDEPLKISTPVTATLVHRLRAHHQAIMVGSDTALSDRPRLDVRLWHGDNPRRVVVDRRGRLGAPTPEVGRILSQLYEEGINSVLVEGGATLLGAMIEAGLWDMIRVEVAPFAVGTQGGAKAPEPRGVPFAERSIDGNTIYYYSNNELVDSFFVENGL